MPKQKLSFEQSMARLEEIVTLLEQGKAGLDQSLKLFEEGAKLVTECNQMLDQAEQKVSQLVNAETGEEAPFMQEQ